MSNHAEENDGLEQTLADVCATAHDAASALDRAAQSSLRARAERARAHLEGTLARADALERKIQIADEEVRQARAQLTRASERADELRRELYETLSGSKALIEVCADPSKGV